MNSLLVLIKKELLEQLRTKKILILAILFLFVAISSPIFAKITPQLLKSLPQNGITINIPEPTYKDSIDQFVKNISQIALLVLVFLVAGAVVDEKNKKTLEIVMTKPLSRPKFVLSKYLSYFLTTSVAFVLASLIFFFYTSSVFQPFNFINFAIISLNILLYVLMIIAITILASTFVKNIISAAGIGFITFILFGTIFSMFEKIKKYSPNTIFSNYQEILANGWNKELFPPIILMTFVILFSIFIAIVIFKRQEIER